MITKILLILAVAITVLLIVAALRPGNFRVARSATIAAPTAVVFGQVNDLHKFQDWSPWAKLDPQCKVDFSGPAAGSGASFTWAGNNQVGAGRMTLIESRPNELIRFRLDFLKPFTGTADAEFTFKPDGNRTVVTWSMFGKNSFPAKIASLFINCDDMVGSQFEKGLAALNVVSSVAVAK
ncbi:MAG TPA: SRPBCC family protein [Opitutaceae bacterium]|nr:SRPBCC family protein [Opitutaceae bacterium]